VAIAAPRFTTQGLGPLPSLWVCCRGSVCGSSELNNQEVAAQVGSKSSVCAAAMRFLGTIGNQRTVTRRTHLRVLPPERRGIESGTVRIEPSSPLSRVTGETVPLGMAGDAALEILSRRLAVAQQDDRLASWYPASSAPLAESPAVTMPR
jgi:hypothetical protein